MAVRTDRPGLLLDQLPIVPIVRWMNREFIQHAAEVALPRDLHRWRARPGSDAPAR